MLPALEPHRLKSWLLINIGAHSQRLLFVQSTDECEDAVRYHVDYYHELIVQASAKTVGSCNQRAQIKFALCRKPQGSSHGAEGDYRYSYESHNFCSIETSYLHAYGTVRTDNCECRG